MCSGQAKEAVEPPGPQSSSRGLCATPHCHAMFESLPLEAAVDGAERPGGTVLPSEHLAQCNALHCNVFLVSVPLKAAADVADIPATNGEEDMA